MNPYRDSVRSADDSERRGWWWDRAEGQAHDEVYAKARSIETRQSLYYQRLLRCAVLYDPYETLGHAASDIDHLPGLEADVSENIVAENVDTVAAIIAAWAGRAVFMTDDGDWSTQRKAKERERYAAYLVKTARVHQTGPKVFKDGAVMGMGFAKVFPQGPDIKVERTLPDEVIVDNTECRTGQPRQLFHRKRVDAEVLIAMFPEHEEKILAARGSGDGTSGRYAGYLGIAPNEVILLEAFRLPIGVKDDERYKPGRRILCVAGCTLVDEEYHRDRFPFAVFRWAERITGYQGLGLVEGLAGHQAQINKLNLQEDAILDTHAIPTTLTHVSEMETVRKTQVTAVGRNVPYKATKPEVITPQGLTNQLSARRQELKASGFERTGVSRLSAHGLKPSGLDSGAAQREYQDITTQRFALQEKAYERFFLDIVELMLMVAQEMDERATYDDEAHPAPIASYKTRYMRKRKIRLADTDMRDVAVEIQAASSLSKTLSGRLQTVNEMAMTGMITPDEARSLADHPDLDRVLSSYVAAREDIERVIEALREGEDLVPETYENLELGVWLVQMAYLDDRGNGADEETLERERTWMNLAAEQLAMMNQPAGPMPMGPDAAGALPQAPMAPPPGGMPGAPPMGPAPMSAFAPGSMAPM